MGCISWNRSVKGLSMESKSFQLHPLVHRDIKCPFHGIFNFVVQASVETLILRQGVTVRAASHRCHMWLIDSDSFSLMKYNFCMMGSNGDEIHSTSLPFASWNCLSMFQWINEGSLFALCPTVRLFGTRASCPAPAVAVLRPNAWSCLFTEHCASGVSWPPAAVHGAPAAGGMEVEQTRRPNPGYRWADSTNTWPKDTSALTDTTPLDTHFIPQCDFNTCICLSVRIKPLISCTEWLMYDLLSKIYIYIYHCLLAFLYIFS